MSLDFQNASLPNGNGAADNGNGNGHDAASQPCGAVLVCGGGVAGIQASLDLSAAGFRVYLVEESPTIGGGMARLDKTFPTGDCATCIISPKLVECMRDYNIDVLTMADVVQAGRRGRPFPGRGATAASKRRRQQMHRLRRLLAGVPRAKRSAADRAAPAQRATRCRDGRQARRNPRSARRHARWPDARAAGRPRHLRLSAAAGARTSGMPLEPSAGRDPARGQFLRRLPPRAGRPARYRGLHGHVVLRPRLGGAASSGSNEKSASARTRPTPPAASRCGRFAASACAAFRQPCGSTAAPSAASTSTALPAILEQFA